MEKPKPKFVLIIGIVVTVIVICIVIGVIVAKNSSATNISSTTYTLTCLNDPAIRSIQFPGPFFVNTVGLGIGYYTLNFYNPLNISVLTQVYQSGSIKYIIPPIGATYFTYTFLCS